MLHINDADQSATPADENKKQEQQGLEPLPWEAGKGFLWGYPATVWLLLRHPFNAFSRPAIGRGIRNDLFLFINCVLFTVLATPIKLIFFTTYEQSNDVPTFIGQIYILLDNLSLTYGSYALYSFCWAGIASIIVHISGHRVSYNSLRRICLMSSASILFVIIPFIGRPLNILVFGLWLPIIGMRFSLKLPLVLVSTSAIISSSILLFIFNLTYHKF